MPTCRAVISEKAVRRICSATFISMIVTMIVIFLLKIIVRRRKITRMPASGIISRYYFLLMELNGSSILLTVSKFTLNLSRPNRLTQGHLLIAVPA
jgi:hypothetical protein